MTKLQRDRHTDVAREPALQYEWRSSSGNTSYLVFCGGTCQLQSIGGTMYFACLFIFDQTTFVMCVISFCLHLTSLHVLHCIQGLHVI